jgi:cell division septum initiation protein DivIVA
MTSPPEQSPTPQRSFRHAFRGYDTAEVQRFVNDMTAQMDALRTDHQVALTRLAELEGPDREAQIDELTQDINRILHAAHAAAQNLRERAATEVSQFVSTSTEHAQRKLRQAEDDAYALRKDAWETAESLLEDVVAHVQSVQTQAEKDALAIVGEAERTAHRKLASANREAETVLKSARLEGEQIKVAAQAERDAMLEDASKSTTAAQERVRALELRRDELLADLNARTTAGGRASQPDGTKAGPGAAEIASTAVKVVRPGDPPSPPARAWLPDDDNDTVRVIQPTQSDGTSKWAAGSDNVRVVPGHHGARPSAADELDVDGAAIADEVRRLHDDAAAGEDPAGDTEDTVDADAGAFDDEVASIRDVLAEMSPSGPSVGESDTPLFEGGSSKGDDRDDVAADSVAADDVTVVDVGVPEPAPTEAVAPATDSDAQAIDDAAEDTLGPTRELRQPAAAAEPMAAPDGPRRLGDATTEIDMLFGRLREQAAPVVMPAPKQHAATEEPASANEVSEDTPLSDLVAPEAVEPFEERDRRLLPITNRVLRSIKRELSENQNVALEALRTEPDTWAPDAGAFAAAVGSEFTILHNEAFAAGSAGAAAITGQADPRPKPFDLAENPVTALAGTLQADLQAALDKGRAAGQGVRELSASVSRVYRAWRTDLAERKVRDLAGSAYHRGMRAAYADLGVHKIRLHIMGAGCQDCRSHAERPFDSGDPSNDVPPFHSECTCTFLPN